MHDQNIKLRKQRNPWQDKVASQALTIGKSASQLKNLVRDSAPSKNASGSWHLNVVVIWTTTK